MKKCLGIVLLAALLPAQAAEPTAAGVSACLRGNVLPGKQVQELELDAVDIHGESRLIKGKLYSQRENLPDAPGLLRATLKISAPEHLAGAAFLLKQTEDRRYDSMYVYLPAVRRVRRINTEFSDGPLLGTNFSYYEFKQLANAFGDLNAKLEGADKYEGRDVSVMSFATSEGDPTASYTSVKLKVDKKTCVPLAADFMKGSAVRKRFTAPSKYLKQSKDYWYVAEVTMTDLLDDTHTTLRILKLDTVDDLPARYFEPNTFYLPN